MKSVIVAMLALTITAAPGIADPEALSESELRRGTRGHLIINVEINGQGPFPFIVDTGAQGSVVFPALVNELGLERDGDEVVRVQGAAAARDMVFYQVDQVTIGNISVENMRAVSGPEGSSTRFADYATYGIIGANILNAYSIEFDFDDARMRFFDAQEEFSDLSSSWYRANYTLNQVGFATFDVSIDDVDIAAILDLGASRHVVNHPAAEALGFDPRADYSETAPASGFSGEGHDIPLITGGRFTLGDLAMDNVELGMMNSPVFGMLGHAGTPAMFLGLPLFEGRSLIFDRANQDILISEES